MKYDWQSLLKGFSERQSKVRKYKINLGAFVEHVFFNFSISISMYFSINTKQAASLPQLVSFASVLIAVSVECLALVPEYIYTTANGKSREIMCAHFTTL